jgi:antitoxin VapB
LLVVANWHIHDIYIEDLVMTHPLARPSSKQVKLFRNNRSQAVRIPAEFALPGDKVLISRDGDRLILEPVLSDSTGLLTLLGAWAEEPPLSEEEDFPDIDEGLLPLKDVEL